MKQFAYTFITLVSLIIFNITYTYGTDDNRRVISEKDAEYVIRGIDIESGKFTPGTPQNDTQSILSASMQDFIQLNVDTNNKISNIGPFEFYNFIELKNKNNVLQLKNNLGNYWGIRKEYYDSMDGLLKKYRKKLNYGGDQNERLAGTAQQFLEKLEEIYVVDLDEFYDFVIQYHAKIIFSENQVYLEDQKLVNKLNTLWSKAVKSASELTNAQEMGSKIIGGSIKEYQKELNTK